MLSKFGDPLNDFSLITYHNTDHKAQKSESEWCVYKNQPSADNFMNFYTPPQVRN